MRELEDRVAKALAMYQFGSPAAWEDQISMARAAIEAIEANGYRIVRKEDEAIMPLPKEYGESRFKFVGDINGSPNETSPYPWRERK